MRKTVITSLFLALAFFAPSMASADPEAKAANNLLLAQLVDTGTTQLILRDPRGYEMNSYARPLQYKGGVVAVASTLAVNGLLRLVFHHKNNAVNVYHGLTAIEIGFALHNVGTLHDLSQH